MNDLPMVRTLGECRVDGKPVRHRRAVELAAARKAAEKAAQQAATQAEKAVQAGTAAADAEREPEPGGGEEA
jgi:hypothetical protein